jgi:predicted AAA+ superfamily ATPase
MSKPATIFKRKLYKRLLDWKENSQGKTALLIEGARRVGKSTLAIQFATNEYDSYLLVDFSNASQKVHKLFDDISDLNSLFMQLQFEYNVVLKPRKSVILVHAKP